MICQVIGVVLEHRPLPFYSEHLPLFLSSMRDHTKFSHVINPEDAFTGQKCWNKKVSLYLPMSCVQCFHLTHFSPIKYNLETHLQFLLWGPKFLGKKSVFSNSIFQKKDKPSSSTCLATPAVKKKKIKKNLQSNYFLLFSSNRGLSY